MMMLICLLQKKTIGNLSSCSIETEIIWNRVVTGGHISISKSRKRFLLDHVGKGIGDYGNWLGIPTLGGEVVIEDSYSGNPLVNDMSLGIVNVNLTASAIAEGVGNPVFIVGAKTGRHGCCNPRPTIVRPKWYEN